MKVHSNHSTGEKEVSTNVCCSTSTNTTVDNSAVCCEQPTDGSSCCDKSLSKEENAAKVSCC